MAAPNSPADPHMQWDGTVGRYVYRNATTPPKPDSKYAGQTPIKLDKAKPGGLNKLVVPSQGARDQSVPKRQAAKAAAAKAASNKNKKTTTTTNPANVPSTQDLSVEDQALQGNYDPNSIKSPGYGGVGNGGTGLATQFDPATFAKSMAGQQYDPAVTQLATRIKGIVAALPGSLESLHKAFANIDMSNAVRQGVVGGPTTAAANQLQQTTAGLTDQQSQQQNVAADTREADWATRIKLLSGANVNEMRGQLQGLTQQRSDAQQAYTMQGIKTKSDLVSQAIANINSMRASNTAAAMAGGILEGQGLKNEAQALANTSAAQQNLYAPYLENSNLTTAGQQQAQNTISLSQAKTQLKQVSPSKDLSGALVKGGAQAVAALQSMIIPANSVVPDTNGYSHVRGDPNVWLKTGVNKIMQTLPRSNRANVTKYVMNEITQAIAPAGGWKMKNGKFVRPK